MSEEHATVNNRLDSPLMHGYTPNCDPSLPDTCWACGQSKEQHPPRCEVCAAPNPEDGPNGYLHLADVRLRYRLIDGCEYEMDVCDYHAEPVGDQPRGTVIRDYAGQRGERDYDGMTDEGACCYCGLPVEYPYGVGIGTRWLAHESCAS